MTILERGVLAIARGSIVRGAVSSPLPSFGAPPVTEVIVAARFKPADRWGLVQLGELASLLGRHGFDREEQRPGFDAPAEQFGLATQGRAFELELMTGVPPVRHWLLNEDGDELLQLQQNWFACNWRKVAPDAAYGRWESRWKAFDRWIREVEDHLSSDMLVYDQVEVTYVNHIEPCDVWSSHGDAHKVFNFLSSEIDDSGSFLPNREQVATDIRYVISDLRGGGNPAGRLSVTLTPGYRQPNSTPIFVLTLTARGAPLESGLDGLKAFAEMGHEWVVRGFTELTTERMHEVWQREA